MKYCKIIQHCPVCSLNLADTVGRTIPYPLKGSRKIDIEPEFITFCNNCGVGIATPVCSGEQFDKYYSDGSYWKKQKVEILSARKYPVPYALAVSRWKLLEPLLSETVKRVSILDIGAGHGFYGMMAAGSHEVHLEKYTCVEKDKALVESLKKTWSIYFKQYTLETVGSIDSVAGNYDVAVLSHILEHQAEPRAFLLSVLAKVKRGGFIFIDVPNQDYLFKQDVFPHLIFFNMSNLQLLMQRCGLTTKLIANYGNDMTTSTINYKNAAKRPGLLARMIMMTKPILPEHMIANYFTGYFDMEKQNINGIWIRAIGQYH